MTKVFVVKKLCDNKQETYMKKILYYIHNINPQYKGAEP